ncbi:hypothetical protein [Pollutibacter soli]|uniref:hypothetical protein n=1 Tax=Pollutibacter soli TaxID=3034157 RepID=UPI00301400F9
MKKIFAITLLIIHVVGLGGYRIFFHYFEKNASVQIVERLDGGGFSEKELVEIKIPYPLPYASNRADYERFDGEVEMNGVHYNYVKRKMVNDTLYLLCIPNTDRNNLNAAKDNLVAGLSDASNDHNAQRNSHTVPVVKPFTAEYFQLIPDFQFAAGSDDSIDFPSSADIAFSSAIISGPFQPPRANSKG